MYHGVDRESSCTDSVVYVKLCNFRFMAEGACDLS